MNDIYILLDRAVTRFLSDEFTCVRGQEFICEEIGKSKSPDVCLQLISSQGFASNSPD